MSIHVFLVQPLLDFPESWADLKCPLDVAPDDAGGLVFSANGLRALSFQFFFPLGVRGHETLDFLGFHPLYMGLLGV